jgi:hypothetical protein
MIRGRKMDRMADALRGKVIPYASFLDCRARRGRIAAELAERDPSPAIDADAPSLLAAGAVRPAELSGTRILPYRVRRH